MTRPVSCLVACLGALTWPVAAGPGRAAAPLSPNPAKVVTATYIGGPGTEWLTAAVFLPSGEILVCGVTLDADITLHGTKARVMGADAPPLEPVKAFPLLGGHQTGKVAVPKLDDIMAPSSSGTDLLGPSKPREKEIKRRQREQEKRLRSIPKGMRWSRPGQTVEKQIVYRKFSWLEPQATGFLAVFSADLKNLRTCLRLPRGAGAIAAAALGKDGALYLAGSATDRIAELGAPTEAETVENPKGVDDSTFGCRRTFLMRLAGDLSKVEWVRDIHGWSIAPVLRVLGDGTVSLHGPGLRTYSPRGKCLRAMSIQNTRVVSGLDVDPTTGRYVRVGDWMSGTGREPYRNPRLYVYNPDGRTHKHLYGWRGPFVGVDGLRLVADSAVRKCAYDQHGNLIVSTWSHGGNNAMFRYPYDIERFVPNRLGHTPMSTCVSVIKMGPDHNVLASTRTDAAVIRDLAVAADGSLVWWAPTRVVAMPNALSDLTSGECLAVASPNLTGYRFFSPMPACGTRVAVGGCNDMTDSWGFASGRSGGRTLLLCLTGAVPTEIVDGKPVAPPQRNPVQKGFGGGLTDGYALLLDLTAEKPWNEYVPPQPKVRKHKPYDGPPLAWPAEGQVFDLGTERYVTVKATFRDVKDAKWPSFYAGRGVKGGTFCYGTRQAKADFVLDCPTVLQEEGMQTQRVCGELVWFTVREITDKKGRPKKQAELDRKVKLVVTDMSPWQRLEDPARYGTRRYPRTTCKLGGTLHVGDKAVTFREAECSAVFHVPKRTDTTVPGTRPNLATLVLRFEISGGQIGLSGPLASETIRVRFTFSASSDVDYAAQQEKRKVRLPTLK